MEIHFERRTVVVTGVARGIGAAIARGFATRGARVIGLDRLPSQEVTSGRGGSYDAREIDLADSSAVQRAMSEIEAQSPDRLIDVVVHAAGGVRGQSRKPLEEVSDADFQTIMDANVTSTFNLARAVAPGMKRAGRGRFIAIASPAGLGVSLTGIQAYGTAKAAEIGLVRQLAHELGPHGITVNAIAPGFMPTSPDYVRQWEGYSPERQRQIIDQISLKRLGSPDDITHAALFLASPYAGFITGQTLVVKGAP